MATNFNSYMKNVLKSVNYIAIDSIKDVNPAISALASTENLDIVKRMYAGVKDYKKTTASVGKAISESGYMSAFKEVKTNFLEDMKSGKFYNKERIEKMDNAAMGFDDFDMDWDFDFDDNIDDGVSFGDKKSDVNDLTSDRMDTIGAKIAEASGKSSMMNAQIVSQSAFANTQALMSHNEALFGRVNNNLAAIHSGIVGIGQIVKPAVDHMINSAKFYENTTKQLEVQNQLIKEMLDITKSRYGEKKSYSSRYGSNKKTYGDITSNGIPNLAAYMESIKGNIKDMTSIVTDVLGMMDSMGGGKKGDGIRSMGASPVSSALKVMTSWGAKKMMGKAGEDFNQTLQGFFGSMISKFNRKADDYGGLNILAKILGIKSENKTTYNTSKYEKGRVDFDGITRKAIIEVIPIQLGKIVALLSGKDEQRYDYREGKFKSLSSLKEENANIFKSNARSATYDHQYRSEKYASKINFGTEEAKDDFMKDLATFYEFFYKTGRMYDYNKMDSDINYLARKIGIKPKNVRLIKEFFKANARTNKGVNMQMAGSIFEQRERATSNAYGRESEGDNIYANLYNNSDDGQKHLNRLDLNSVKDDKGNNIFFYLQNMYSDMKRIADNTSGSGGGGNGIRNKSFGKGSSGKGSNRYDVPVSKTIQLGDSRAWKSTYYPGTLDPFTADADQLAAAIKPDDDRYSDYKEYSPYSYKNLSEDMRNASSIKEIAGAVGKYTQSILALPGRAVAIGLKSAESKIYNLIFGKEDDDKYGYGILNKMENFIKGSFEKMDKWINENIAKFRSWLGESALGKGVKTVGRKLFGTKDEQDIRSGGTFGDFIQSTKGELGKAKTWSSNAIRDTSREVRGWVSHGNKGVKIEGAYDGGNVTRTGVVAVSEGEYIVPAEENPYYNKKVDKSSQRFKEAAAKSKYNGSGFKGSYADGGNVNDDPSRDANIFAEAISALLSGAKAAGERLFGKPGKTGDSEQSKAINSVIGDLTKNIKGYAPTMAAGALIGGGASLLTGMVGGPLLGAAVGAATGLVLRSNVLQDSLFGKVGADGDREGSVFLNKEISNFITKKLPGMAKFGITGAVASLIPGIPGGPIAGLLIGSTLGYLKTSESFKQTLFGDEGLINKDVQERIKKAAPNIFAGAGVGLLAGPFGVVGNIMVGSAIGYASTTDKFKEALFGIKDENGEYYGGVLGTINEHVVSPLIGYVKENNKNFMDWMKKRFVDPLASLVKPLGRRLEDMVTGMGKSFSSHLVLPLWRRLDKFLGIFTSKVAMLLPKGLGRAAGELLGLPFRAIGKAGKAMTKYDVKSGKAGYMTAAERMAFRRDNYIKDDAFEEHDTYLANASMDDLNKDISNVMGANKLRDERDKAKSKVTRGLGRTLEGSRDQNWFNKRRSDIIKAINAGNTDEAYRLANDKGFKISETDRSKLIKEISEYSGKMTSIDDKYKSVDEATALKGLHNSGSADLKDYLKRLNKEKTLREKHGIRDRTPEEQISDYTKDSRDYLRTIAFTLAEVFHMGKHLPESFKPNNANVPIMGNPIGAKDTVNGKGFVTDIKAPGSRAANDPRFMQGNGFSTNIPNPNYEHYREDTGNNQKTTVIDQDTMLPVPYIMAKGGNLEPDPSDQNTAIVLKAKAAKNKFYATASGAIAGFASMGKFFTKLFGGKGEDGEDGKDGKKKGGILGMISGLMGGSASGMFGAVATGAGLLMGIGLLEKSGMLEPFIDKILVPAITTIGDVLGKLIVKLVPAIASGVVKLIPELISLIPAGIKGLYNTAVGIEDGLIRGGEKTQATKDADYVQANLPERFAINTIGKNVLVKGQRSNVLKHIPVVGKTMNLAVQGTATVANSGATYLANKTGKSAFINYAKHTGAKEFVTESGESALKSMAKQGAESAAEVAAAGSVKNGIIGQISKFAAKAPLPKGLKSFLVGGFADTLGEAVGKEAAKKAGKKGLSSLVETVFAPLNVVFAIEAAFNAAQDARSVLGIIDEPTAGQRFIASIVVGLYELIPIIGGLFPAEWLMNLLISGLHAAGMDQTALIEQRERAKAVVAQYNKENGTNFTVREYNKNVLGDYTLREKAVNAVKDMGSGMKDLAGKAWEGLKSTGNAIGEGIQSFGKSKVGSALLKSTKRTLDPTGMITAMAKGTMEGGLGNGFKAAKDAAVDKVKGFTDSKVGQVLMKSAKRTLDPTGMLGAMAKGTMEGGLLGGFKSVGEKIKKVVSSTSILDISKLFDSMTEYADIEKHKTMDGFRSLAKVKEEDNVFNTLNSIIANLMVSIGAPIISIIRGFKHIADWIPFFKDKDKKAGDATDSSDNTTVKDDKPGWFESFFDNIFKKKETGSGSGFVSQTGGSYANVPFGKSGETIGSNGCGPAVASMLVGPNRLSVTDAARYAQMKGYAASGSGTQAGYFEDILGQYGMSASYSDKKSDIYSSIRHGSGTVLLGQDSSNASKANSPFGPNPHYVLAQGTDNYGNVIVNDPELNGPAVYDKSILNNTKMGVMTGGATGIHAADRFNDATSKKKSSTSGNALLAANSIPKVELPVVNNKKRTSAPASSYAAANQGSITSDAMNNTVGAAAISQTASTQIGDYVGKYVKQFESGTRGSTAWSQCGSDGGGSFGTYQMIYKYKGADGAARQFWREYYANNPKYGPETSMTNLKELWKRAATDDPEGFYANEHAFMYKTHYNKAMAGLNNFDPNTKSRALQESFWAWSVHRGGGGASKEFNALGLQNPQTMDEAKLLNAIYDKRAAVMHEVGYDSIATGRYGVGSADKSERTKLLGILGNNPIDPQSFGGAGILTQTGQGDISSTGAAEENNSFSGTSGFLDMLFGKIGTAIFGGKDKNTQAIGQALGLYTPTETADGTTTYSNETTTNFGASGVIQNASEAEKSVVSLMAGIKGKNEYSQNQNLRYKVGDTLEGKDKGWGDCSSTVQWAYKKALNINPGGDTGSQYVDGDGRDIPGKLGTPPPEDQLRPGDLLYYNRGTHKPDGVGHVEMYMGNNKIMGHNDGMGPTEKEYSTYGRNKFLKARRFIPESQSGTNQATIAPANQPQIPKINLDPNAIHAFENMPRAATNAAASGSGLKVPSGYFTGGKRGSYSSNDVIKFVGSGSGLTRSQKLVLGDVSRKLKRSTGGAAGVDSSSMALLFQQAIMVLQNISNNTGRINSIIELLSSYFNTKLSIKDQNNSNGSVAVIQQKSTGEEDAALKQIMSQLQAIAGEV